MQAERNLFGKPPGNFHFDLRSHELRPKVGAEGLWPVGLPENEAAWKQETRRRLAEIENGTV